MAYVKFIGNEDGAKYKDSDSFNDLICYITNPEKAISIGFANVTSLATAAVEMQAVAAQGRKSSGKKICHIVVAFSPEESRAHSVSIISDVAQKIQQYFGSRYHLVYAIHSTPHKHIHIIFNRVSFVDYKRYLDRYEDRNKFWYYLYQILACYNIRLWKH